MLHAHAPCSARLCRHLETVDLSEQKHKCTTTSVELNVELTVPTVTGGRSSIMSEKVRMTRMRNARPTKNVARYIVSTG